MEEQSAMGYTRRRTHGQALVEFALVLIPFLLIVLGIVDVGRGIYVYNGVAEAAREIARVTSVHPGTPLGTSPETQEVMATQEGLIPGLEAAGITIQCTDLAGSVAESDKCFVGATDKYVEVSVSVPFHVVTLSFLPVPPTIMFTSVSHVQLP